jgi:hypothetical protein
LTPSGEKHAATSYFVVDVDHVGGIPAGTHLNALEKVGAVILVCVRDNMNDCPAASDDTEMAHGPDNVSVIMVPFAGLIA